ncbi:MAG: hypothetical protein ACLQGP_02995 [Isosphaeraceae bacterium]
MLLRRHTLALTSALTMLALAVGCSQDASTTGKLKTRETLKKTTQDVRELKAELAKGGVLADSTIPVDDPLTQSAAAYRTQVAKIAQMRVQQDMNMYEALNGEKPKTYEEFMELIIKKGKADGIQLPMLPYYQEYAYDTDKKELVVVEYPEKKKAISDQVDKAYGRK